MPSGVAEEGMVSGLVHLPYSLSIIFLPAFSLPHPQLDSLFIGQETPRKMDHSGRLKRGWLLNRGKNSGKALVWTLITGCLIGVGGRLIRV